MCFGGRLPAHTHVRSLVVIEADDALHLGSALLSVGDDHAAEPLRLENAVGAFGDGVFQRVATLGHAYLYPSAFECLHIDVAAVLAAAVGVVDEIWCVAFRQRGQCHVQCLQWVCGVKRRS